MTQTQNEGGAQQARFNPTEDSEGRANRISSNLSSPEANAKIDELIAFAGGDASSPESKFIRELLQTSLKVVKDGRDSGELKLMASTLKEIRHAYRVFADYPHAPKVSIFGSARTPSEHPDYIRAVEFSRMMAEHGWLVITGAGDGIMKAGHEGPGRDSSFGLSIRLPFETTANEIIAGDSKLINFRYFFTRKLMFVSQADAVVCFPGGFGTNDEAFEVLTLIQTGKSSIVPVVMLEGKGGTYWRDWNAYINEALMKTRFISPEDYSIYYIAEDSDDAERHIKRFYRNYHSSRYVRDDLVLRIKHRITDEDVARLNHEFDFLVKSGSIEQRGPYEVETDHLDLPRIAFTHTRRNYGIVRKLIDRINDFEPAEV